MSLSQYLEVLVEEKRSEEMKKEAFASLSDEDLMKVAFSKSAKKDMPPFLEQNRPAKVKEIYGALKRDHPDMPAGMKARIASRQGKKGKQHQGPPYKGPLTKGASWDSVVKAVKGFPGAVANKARQVKGTYQTAAAGPLGQGVSGPLLPGQSRGVGAGLKAVATQHPGVAAGVAGATGLGAGYALSPSGGQNKTAALLLKVGDAVGRMLAKEAAEVGLPISELQESMEEARAREDVPGRARKSAILGGIGGGTLGAAGGAAAGYGLGRVLGLPRVATSAVSGALGGIGGGMLGAAKGKEYGTREAEADKVLSALRAARAAQLGYGAGVQRGYMAGMQGEQG
jgi:hypothetical protein